MPRVQTVDVDLELTANEDIAQEVIDAMSEGRFKMLGNEGSMVLIGIEPRSCQDNQLSLAI